MMDFTNQVLSSQIIIPPYAELPMEEAPEGHSITALLSRASAGDGEAFNRLMPLVYRELHRMAERSLRRETRNNTLQPTALVHEAYLRLVDYKGADYRDRMHFFAIAARVMRQILVDHARARHTAKRGGAVKVELDHKIDCAPEPDQIVIALDDALQALAFEDDKKARFVEMRFFGGMTAEEIAQYTAMSVHTVRHELRIAQAWLRREMGA